MGHFAGKDIVARPVKALILRSLSCCWATKRKSGCAVVPTEHVNVSIMREVKMICCAATVEQQAKIIAHLRSELRGRL